MISLDNNKPNSKYMKTKFLTIVALLLSQHTSQSSADIIKLKETSLTEIVIEECVEEIKIDSEISKENLNFLKKAERNARLSNPDTFSLTSSFLTAIEKANNNYTETTLRELAILEAKKHLGTKYVWGGKSPGRFDCSGFTSYVMNKIGIVISSGSKYQALQGKKIQELTSAKKGDIIVFSKSATDKNVKHVGLITKSNNDSLMVIHATSSKGIIEENIYKSKYWKPTLLYAIDVITETSIDADTKYPIEVLKTSKYLKALLAEMEHFSPYPSYAGGYAIGFGHAISKNNIKYYENNPIDLKTALILLEKDIQANENALKKALKNYEFTQYQFDALVSLSFNSGIGNLLKKDLIKKIKNNENLELEDFVNTLSRSKKKVYNGLVRRRMLEYHMYNNTYILSDRYNLL